VLGGDSAGGGLALALLAELIRHGAPLPAACFALSPLADMTFSGASITENAAGDVILPASRIEELTALFLGDQDPADPRVSPLFARFDGAPPVWLTAGSTEILRDDSRRLADHLRDAGVDVSYTETHDLPHVWPIFQTFLPEARASLRDLGAWISQQVPPPRES
jgi:acetyl esterase/lipase